MKLHGVQVIIENIPLCYLFTYCLLIYFLQVQGSGLEAHRAVVWECLESKQWLEWQSRA